MILKKGVKLEILKDVYNCKAGQIVEVDYFLESYGKIIVLTENVPNSMCLYTWDQGTIWDLT